MLSLSLLCHKKCSFWNKYLYTMSVSVPIRPGLMQKLKAQQLFIVLCTNCCHCNHVLSLNLLRSCQQHVTRWHQSARFIYWEHISHPVICHLFCGTKGQRSVQLYCSSPQIPRLHSVHLERKTNSWATQHLDCKPLLAGTISKHH